ncbi:MAG: phosphate/phosphite/phosphonate ABC transporter substrate-binding protein [Bdellovibrionales bacterium]|jgi:phosphonate transport system substrate-binding protein|nr:phosphate/phosphite/phosphonate ABC transporter substrate-binding protein [Bdellovibrionales bacterium]MBT3524659.1 phosphate/phosphite/phosphonate ABC transporter substrate-binding protein [Bdellovibrionales bacterium]MBT7670213.1 phosphate/phosphite/phosphonate ABC transporter substrate-binding protein [Bdellovibrionales bacterium]
MSLLKKIAFLVLSISVCTFTIVNSAHSKTKALRFGIAPYYDKERIYAGFAPLMDHLSKKLGRPVTITVTDQYEDLKKLICNGDLDVGILGAVLYVKLKNECPQIKYLVTTQATKSGKKRSYYFSWFITLKKSGIIKMKHLKGKSFAFVSTHSSSGYVFPMTYFSKRKIVPDDYFSKVEFTGSHSKVTDYIAGHKIDAGVVGDMNLWAAERKHGKIFRRLKKIGPILNLAVAASKHLDATTRQKITEELTSLPPSVFNNDLPYTGFEKLSDKNYNLTREAIKVSQ